MNIPLLYSENYFNSSFLVMVRTYHAFHERDKMDLSYLPKVKKIFQMQTPFSVLFLINKTKNVKIAVSFVRIASDKNPLN